MGIDFGRKKIGLAVSVDKTALPFGIIENKQEVAAEIRNLCCQEKIDKIVIGLPLNLDGIEGEAAERVRRFGRNLEGKLRLGIYFWDERLTTVEAKEKQRGGKRKDDIAAAIMLQSYLDSKD